MANLIYKGRTLDGQKWLVRIFLGRNPDTGRQEFHNTVRIGTKTEVKQWAAAEEAKRDLLGSAAAGAARLTVGTLLDDLLLDYRINGKSYDWARMVVDVHLRPFFGDLIARKLGSDHGKRYIAKRQKDGAANATINRELAILRRSLNLAAQSDPPKLARVPRLPRLEENNVRTGFLEDSEYRAIMRELPEHLRPLIAFAYYTGCRRGELLKLKWQSVDLIDGVVRLEAGTTKNKEARMIPLNPELVELLAMRKAKRDSEFPSCGAVFFGAKGEPIRDFKDGWRYACYRAGLWQGDDFKTGRPTRIFHDLRRTGVRNNVRAGVPEKVAQEISGHKTRAVFERYNIVNERDLKEAARRQYEYIQQQRAAAQSCTKVAPSGDSAGSLAVQ